MDFMDFLNVLKWIGVIAGAIISVITLTTILSKKPKKWLMQITKEANAENFKQINEELKKIHDFNKQSERSDICILRHEITSIYHKYKDKQELPTLMKENLCSLYENYRERKGNSYVERIYNEMMTWKVI